MAATIRYLLPWLMTADRLRAGERPVAAHPLPFAVRSSKDRYPPRADLYRESNEGPEWGILSHSLVGSRATGQGSFAAIGRAFWIWLGSAGSSSIIVRTGFTNPNGRLI
jgi:hypothetical protein